MKHFRLRLGVVEDWPPSPQNIARNRSTRPLDERCSIGYTLDPGALRRVEVINKEVL